MSLAESKIEKKKISLLRKFITNPIYILDTFTFIFGLLKLIFNPNDISAIFKVKSFRNHKSVKQTMDSFYSNPEISDLIKERFLSEENYDLSSLSNLPEGTLGKEFADHMIKNNLDLVFFPPLEKHDKNNDDMTYIRMRSRQTHDIHHVVLGFPAIDVGEMAISGFYLAQNRVPLSGLLIGVGFLRAVLVEPHRIDELVECVIKGWKMGKKSKDVLGVKWENLWEKNLDDIRTEMNIDKKLMMNS